MNYRRLIAIAILTFLGGMFGSFIGREVGNEVCGPNIWADSESEKPKRNAIFLGLAVAGAIAAPLYFVLTRRRRLP